MDMLKVDSSVIDSIGYENGEKALFVQMKSGNRYVYKNVPESVFEELHMAASPNAYLQRNIRRRYEEEKIR